MIKFLCTLSMLCLTTGVGLNQISEERFQTLMSTVQPAAGQKWTSVGWLTSLVEAQHRSVDTGKPIFIWAMDGHPIGCV